MVERGAGHASSPLQIPQAHVDMAVTPALGGINDSPSLRS